MPVFGSYAAITKQALQFFLHPVNLYNINHWLTPSSRFLKQCTDYDGICDAAASYSPVTEAQINSPTENKSYSAKFLYIGWGYLPEQHTNGQPVECKRWMEGDLKVEFRGFL